MVCVEEFDAQLLRHCLPDEPVFRLGGPRFLSQAFIGNFHLVPPQKNVGVFALGLKLSVIREVPQSFPMEPVMLADAGHAVAWFYGMFHFGYAGPHASLSRSGKVILHDPGSIPSTRAKPLWSSVPSATVSPSGRVILYFSPGKGSFSSSTI